MEKTYHIITFGCQMNERDSETLAGMLQAEGYTYTDDKEAAEVVLLNTCSVRENADKKFFGVLGQLKHSHEANPDKVVGVCGCMMQQQHIIDMLKSKYPWVDIVFGTHNVAEFPRLLNNVQTTKKNIVEVPEDEEAMAEGLPAKRAYSFKAFVNVMYGCNNFCSYCIVPYTRGRERSRRPEDILAEIRDLAAHGCKEITLLGQNVNSYGKVKHGEGSYCYKDEPDGGVDFAKLIRMIDEIEGIERIRFMTSHPKDLSDDLIECFRDCKHLCHFFHLPVQSGSDRILKEMNRHYDREKYFERVEKLKEACPDISLSTDIIVGFPGETEEDFEGTLDLVRRVRYESAFTFIYSVRRGTPAAAMENQVPEDVKHERFNRLVDTIHEIQEEISKKYQDQVLPVLIEGPSKTDPEVLTGRTESGKTVDLKAPAELIGQIVPVKIVKAQTFSLYGELA
ncbi:MAG: tRNA (N6-isopentenyl adenosine(37)-C2)-methylthiotransferase MiaB [Clostridia bacterium]|nr:tRNA (N6-isopentenyl adenosine(37)-C2)-methylthiotransferase MiaB [Clostridia bacterium]